MSRLKQKIMCCIVSRLNKGYFLQFFLYLFYFLYSSHNDSLMPLFQHFFYFFAIFSYLSIMVSCCLFFYIFSNFLALSISCWISMDNLFEHNVIISLE